MLRFFYFFLLLTLTDLTYGQLDVEHWFPPIRSTDNANSPNVDEQFAYLSTPEPNPIQVEIYDGGYNLLSTHTISQGNPAQYQIGTLAPSKILLETQDLNKVLTSSGLIFRSTKPFYANIRGGSISQAFSATCKGAAGKGKRFRLGVAPTPSGTHRRNFFAGIMATEDNTQVLISGYDPGVIFNGIPNDTQDQISVTLNSGESYVVEGQTDHATANLQGFVGALVTSDKPVVVNFGNSLGTIASHPNAQDHMVDQAIPSHVIGSEYVLVEADGSAEMERPIVVADQDNTDIYVNGNLVTQLDDGEWILLDNNYFLGVGHRNMHISTTNPVYVTQFMGGDPFEATPGMYVVPPYTCFLDKKIDLVPDIDRIGNRNFNGGITIVADGSANLYINGVVQTGGVPVLSRPGTVTYKIPGLVGNTVIESDTRMLLGIYGYNDLAGYGGFFSGFDTVPPPKFFVTDSCQLLESYIDSTELNKDELIELVWNYGDGTQLSNLEFLNSYNYPVAGSYDLEVIINRKSGCNDTLKRTVEVFPLPQLAISVADDCVNEPLDIINTSTIATGSMTYDWDMGDGVLSNDIVPVHQYTAAGVYPIKVIVESDKGCKDSVEMNVERLPIPVAFFKVKNGCDGEEVLFQDLSQVAPPSQLTDHVWNYGDGSAYFSGLPSKHIYSQPGTYTVNLIVLSDGGCGAQYSKDVEIFPLPIMDVSDTSICINEQPLEINNSTVVSSGSIVASEWEMGDGGVENTYDAIYTYGLPGEYNVWYIGTTDKGCKDSMGIKVTIKDIPNVDFTVDEKEGCSPLCVNFSDISTSVGGAIVSWGWEFGDGNVSSLNTPLHCYVNSDREFDMQFDVQLWVEGTNGCVDTLIKPALIDVWHQPLAAFEVLPGLEIDVHNSEVNMANLGAGYAGLWWGFGNGDTSLLESPGITYIDSGSYEITMVTVSDKGCVDTARQIVHVAAVPSIYVPNCITANEDGLNDGFIYQGYGINEEDTEMSIYNRWGELLYYTQKGIPWDGKYEGLVVPTDVYVYKIVYSTVMEPTLLQELIGKVVMIK